jgi:dTDP-glucose 4,6-dehydratase
MQLNSSDSSSIHSRFFIDDECWKNAPLLKGTTHFEPVPGMKTIMITGGAGFM